MGATNFLGVGAAFFAGAAVALLVGYPVPANSHVMAFWAVLLGMTACVLVCVAAILHAIRKERVSAERVIDLTVDRMLEQRGLEVVRDG